MDRSAAQEISTLMLEYGAKLDASVTLVTAHSHSEEGDRYRKAVGHIMGVMLTEIMNPLYKEHPDLKPRQLK